MAVCCGIARARADAQVAVVYVDVIPHGTGIGSASVCGIVEGRASCTDHGAGPDSHTRVWVVVTSGSVWARRWCYW